jgi:hypothetical protein
MTAFLGVALCPGSSACSNLGGGSCTAVGCASAASVHLESSTGAWTPGTYELAILVGAVDASQDRCTMTIPEAPSPTSLIVASCTGNSSWTFSSIVTCETHQSSGAVGESCRPVPGHFDQTLTLAGTPARVTLSLSRGGQQILVAPVSFTYRDFQPNGPQCGPACHEASAQLTVLDDGMMDSGSAADTATDGDGAPD